MPQSIDIELERWTGGTSQPFHRPRPELYRKAESLTDASARLTPRQAVFYRNLIRMAEKLGTPELPIDFVDANGEHQTMDLGCVKMAEHAGFLEPLIDGPEGIMKTVRLAWKVTVS